MQNNKIHSVYQITNKVNGKIYIGYTSVNPNRRWTEHKQIENGLRNRMPLAFALRKHGVASFEFEVLYQSKHQQDALDKEEYFIKETSSQKKTIGYNVRSGGVAPSFNQKKGREHHWYGRRHKPETIEKMRESASGIQEEATCPHCGKTGGISGMTRWHFDNCRSKDETSLFHPKNIDLLNQWIAEGISQPKIAELFNELGVRNAKGEDLNRLSIKNHLDSLKYEGKVLTIQKTLLKENKMTPLAKLKQSKIIEKKSVSLQYCRKLCGTLASTPFYQEDGTVISFTREEAAEILSYIRGSKWGQTKEWFIENCIAQPSDEILLDVMELGWSNTPISQSNNSEVDPENIEEETENSIEDYEQQLN
jgi:group I intron endonuclease